VERRPRDLRALINREQALSKNKLGWQIKIKNSANSVFTTRRPERRKDPRVRQIYSKCKPETSLTQM
jgi:hypothetical protein